MRIAVSRAPGAERVVFPLELFFDLVHGFAIGQLSHHLLEHVDLRIRRRDRDHDARGRPPWYMTAWGPNWLMVLALIAVAVGDEPAIAHPGDDATLGFTLLAGIAASTAVLVAVAVADTVATT